MIYALPVFIPPPNLVLPTQLTLDPNTLVTKFGLTLLRASVNWAPENRK